MALRALGLNLTRRLFSRGNAHTQAVSSQRIPQAASLSSSDRAVRSFYTFRDPDIVVRTLTAGVAAFVGLVGILFFKERSDGSSGGVTDEEVLGKKPLTINEEVPGTKPVTTNEELPGGKKPVTLNEEPTYQGSLLWGAKISRAELEHDRRYREMRWKKECNQR